MNDAIQRVRSRRIFGIVGIAGRPRPEGNLPPRDRIEELLGQIASGSEAALDNLYRETSHRVYGLVARLVGDRSLAEEVTLDIYTRIWQGSTPFDASRGGALGWLLLLARSRAIDARRSLGRRVRVEDPVERAAALADDAPGPERSALEDDRARRVRTAMGLLSSEQRAAIDAAYFGGLSHTEVAESLDAPLGTIKTRIRTGLAILKRALEATEGVA